MDGFTKSFFLSSGLCFLILFPNVFTIDGSDDEEDNPLGAIIGVLVVLSDARLASLRLAATVAMQSLSLEVSCILEPLRSMGASNFVF